jgi:23S rRNA pseudouridine1911/1915/1917 synthase
VPEAFAGKTLETFLRAGFAEGDRTSKPGDEAGAGGLPSWSRVRGLVRGRRIMIDGNVCTDGARRLRAGEVVKLLAAAAPAPPTSADLRIVYLDEHCVVVEKPPGITTVRHREERSWPARRRQLQPTLDELLPLAIARELAERRFQEKRLADPDTRRGSAAASRRSRLPRTAPVFAVHRIDRETSGLVVFARSIPAARILAEQFRVHDTQRRYLAIVEGRPATRTIRSHLVRDRGDGRRGSADEESGKLAITHVRTVERLGPRHSLVECRLETGRTHQIRIHLSEAGHPLVGERVYRSKASRPGDRRRAQPEPTVGRVALHAAELGFVHPASGERVRFECPLPRDLRELARVLAGRG